MKLIEHLRPSSYAVIGWMRMDPPDLCTLLWVKLTADMSTPYKLGHFNRMSCFWLSALFNSDVSGLLLGFSNAPATTPNCVWPTGKI